MTDESTSWSDDDRDAITHWLTQARSAAWGRNDAGALAHIAKALSIWPGGAWTLSKTTSWRPGATLTVSVGVGDAWPAAAPVTKHGDQTPLTAVCDPASECGPLDPADFGLPAGLSLWCHRAHAHDGDHGLGH